MQSFLLLSICLVVSATVHADSVMPYPNIGHPAPDVNLTAPTTGNIEATYTGGDAGGKDYIRLVDMTSGVVNAFVADNYDAVLGETFDLGVVTEGDRLRLELLNYGFSGENYTQVGSLTSIGAYSTDGISHVYAQKFTNGSVNGVSFVGANTYVGFEDLPLGNTDLDYNDTTFVLSDVSATATPEPTSLVFLGTGLAAMGGILRRQIAS